MTGDTRWSLPGDVPTQLMPLARLAVSSCPVMALRLAATATARRGIAETHSRFPAGGSRCCKARPPPLSSDGPPRRIDTPGHHCATSRPDLPPTDARRPRGSIHLPHRRHPHMADDIDSTGRRTTPTWRRRLLLPHRRRLPRRRAATSSAARARRSRWRAGSWSAASRAATSSRRRQRRRRRRSAEPGAGLDPTASPAAAPPHGRRTCSRWPTAIGITTTQLQTEMSAGKTIAAIAKEHNVDPANGDLDAGDR